MLNTPAKQVVGDNRFCRGIELVSNKDVNTVIIVLIPFPQNDNNLQGYITISEFCLKWVRFMWDFTSIRGCVGNGFYFMPVMLLDEGNELIWFYKTPCFLLRMVHEDISVWLNFRKEDFVMWVDVFKEFCWGVPGIKGNSREIKGSWGIIEEFHCYLDFVFKLRISLTAWKFIGGEIRDYIDRKMFWWWHENSANTDIADFFSFEWATVLPFSALSILRIGFGTSGVIYGKNPIFCGGSGSLVLNDF